MTVFTAKQQQVYVNVNVAPVVNAANAANVIAPVALANADDKQLQQQGNVLIAPVINVVNNVMVNVVEQQGISSNTSYAAEDDTGFMAAPAAKEHTLVIPPRKAVVEKCIIFGSIALSVYLLLFRY
ncbi:MAG: hypothetical protein SGARI_000342 [Bacillariaceae sp.]